jgi:hypothetical protein
LSLTYSDHCPWFLSWGKVTAKLPPNPSLTVALSLSHTPSMPLPLTASHDRHWGRRIQALIPHPPWTPRSNHSLIKIQHQIIRSVSEEQGQYHPLGDMIQNTVKQRQEAANPQTELDSICFWPLILVGITKFKMGLHLEKSA